MSAYIIRRILFMIPTLLGIMLVSFVVVQFAPGGPVERVIAQLSGSDTGATSRISGSQSGDFSSRGAPGGSQVDASSSKYRGAQGLDPEFIKSLEKQFGFDKPAYERFALMLWNYARFDFGKSYFRDVRVLDLIKEKMPVSMSLGLWMALISYFISIPLEQEVAYETFDRAGINNLEHELIRMHLNGPFWGVYVGFESPSGAWLDKHNYDSNSELYKARSVESPAQWKNSAAIQGKYCPKN